jgi:hypothetical protein
MNNAQISLEYTPKQIELVKAMVSHDEVTAMKAKSAFAAFLGPVIQQVLNMAGFVQDLYKEQPFDEDDLPMFPLDLYYDNTNVNSIVTWMQNDAGGLGTTSVWGLKEMPISTFRLDGAISFLEKTLRRGRLNYVELGMNRLAQQILRKIEYNGIYIILKALAEARTNGSEHLIQTTTTDVLQIDDFNRLLTLSDTINTAWDGSSTPDQQFSGGATDLYLSSLAMEQIRAMAYQPMNTRGVPNSDESTAVALPEAIRQEIYRNAGASEIYGKTLHKFLEFGLSKRYNNIFDTLYNANSPALTFATANQELVLGVDRSRGALIKPVAKNATYGTTFTTKVDNQWSNRSEKIGFYGGIELGFAVIDSRVLSGLIIK